LFFVSIVTFFVLTALGFFYKNAFFPDTWLEKTQKQVLFKILKPTVLPSGFQQTLRFNIIDSTLPNNPDALIPTLKTNVKIITSGYGSNEFKPEYNQPIGVTVLRQYEIPGNFDFDQMIDSELSKLFGETVEKVVLDGNKVATIISGNSRSSKGNTSGADIIKIFFITSDNTLINLSGAINKNYRKEDYIKMAASLR